MATIAEVEKLAVDLPENQRSLPAAHLLGSVPAVLHDEDEGIAEALRRDAEMDADPSANMSLEQIDARIKSRRRNWCEFANLNPSTFNLQLPTPRASFTPGRSSKESSHDRFPPKFFTRTTTSSPSRM